MRIRHHKKSLLVLMALAIVLAGCKDSSGNDDSSVEVASSDIEISKEQKLAGDIVLGNPQRRALASSIACNGVMELKPMGKASVNVPFHGHVGKVYVNPGEHVKRGQTLFTLESREFIRAQETALRLRAKLPSLEASAERQQTLSKEGATSELKLNEAQAEYNTALVEYESIQEILAMVNVTVSDEIHGQLLVRSPITGIVKDLNIHQGSTLKEGEEALVVINPRDFRLKLAVPAEVAGDLQLGQSVYTKNSTGEETLSGKISSIEPGVDEPTKSISTYVELTPSYKGPLIDGLFVMSSIQTGSKDALVVPISAIVREGELQVLAELNDSSNNTFRFQKKVVDVINKDENWAEIIGDAIDTTTTIVVKGAFQLLQE